MRARTFDKYWTVSRRPGRKGLEVKLRRCTEEITITEARGGEVSILFERSWTEVMVFALVRKPDGTYEKGSFDESSAVFINRNGRTVFVVSDVTEGDRVVHDMRKGRFENMRSPIQCSAK